MFKTIKVLELRNLSLQHIADYYSVMGYGSIAMKFDTIVSRGNGLIRTIKNLYCKPETLVNRLSEDLLRQIRNYLLDGEIIIKEAGVRILSEYCEAKEILPNFADQRIWLLSYLENNRPFRNSVKS